LLEKGLDASILGASDYAEELVNMSGDIQSSTNLLPTLEKESADSLLASRVDYMA